MLFTLCLRHCWGCLGLWLHQTTCGGVATQNTQTSLVMSRVLCSTVYFDYMWYHVGDTTLRPCDAYKTASEVRIQHKSKCSTAQWTSQIPHEIVHCSTKSASVFVAERISPAAASIQLNCICIALHTCTSCTKPITQCYATAQWTHTRSMQQPKAMVTATPKNSHALHGNTPVGIHTVYTRTEDERRLYHHAKDNTRAFEGIHLWMSTHSGRQSETHSRV